MSTTPTWAQSEKVIIQFKSAPAARHFANRSLPGVSAIQPLYGTQKWVAAWIEEKKIWALLPSPEIELIENLLVISQTLQRGVCLAKMNFGEFKKLAHPMLGNQESQDPLKLWWP